MMFVTFVRNFIVRPIYSGQGTKVAKYCLFANNEAAKRTEWHQRAIRNYKKSTEAVASMLCLVETRGFEPMTSSM